MTTDIMELLPLSESQECAIPDLIMEVFRVIDPDIPDY